MADQAKPFDQNLEWKDGRGVFEVRPNRGGDSFKPVNSNGSQRGNRPFIGWLPRPVKRAQILEGAEFKPVITANFILVPRPAGEDAGKTLRVVFSAEAVE